MSVSVKLIVGLRFFKAETLLSFRIFGIRSKYGFYRRSFRGTAKILPWINLAAFHGS